VPIVIHVSGLSVGVSRAGGGVGSVASATSRMWITNDDAGQNTQDFSVFYDDHILDQFGAPLNSSNNFVTDTKLLTRANTDRVAVTLDTYAVVISSYTNAVGKANAMIDPYITIDPSFPDAALYSIVMSTGVSNSPPVPEPSAPLMLTAGLLGLALRLRQGSASGRAQSRNTRRATSSSPMADPRA
jgi:hypothetical protein